MPCEITRFPGGGVMITCSRGGQPAKCSVCGAPAPRLCDWPTGSGTCDKPLCLRHAKHGCKPGRDYCPEHDLKGAWL